MTLGPYPAIGLSEARTMALVKRAEIAQGKNPMAERVKAKPALARDWTVRQLIQDYRQKVFVTLDKSTRVCYSRHLKRIENRFGSLSVREVESSDIVALITGVRGAELFTAKWKDVHLDEARWHIPASKTGPAMDVPLAPELIDWFKELRTFAFRSTYVLPARVHTCRSSHRFYVPAASACPGSRFEVDAMASRAGGHFPRPRQTVRRRDCLASR